jgi:ribonuclease PH
MRQKSIKKFPIRSQVAAISTGVLYQEVLLDLCYTEDVKAEVDFNVVMDGALNLVEVQGTAEQQPFSIATMLSLVELATTGIQQMMAAQNAAISKLAPY